MILVEGSLALEQTQLGDGDSLADGKLVADDTVSRVAAQKRVAKAGDGLVLRRRVGAGHVAGTSVGTGGREARVRTVDGFTLGTGPANGAVAHVEVGLVSLAAHTTVLARTRRTLVNICLTLIASVAKGAQASELIQVDDDVVLTNENVGDAGAAVFAGDRSALINVRLAMVTGVAGHTRAAVQIRRRIFDACGTVRARERETL